MNTNSDTPTALGLKVFHLGHAHIQTLMYLTVATLIAVYGLFMTPLG